MLLYPLCSALLSLSLSLPPLLYSFSSFSILGCRVAGSPGRRVAGSPGCRVAGLPGRRVAGSPGRRVAGSPGCRVAGYHCFSSLKPSAPSRALCSGSNKNLLSISQTEMGISSSPFKVSSCSQKR